MAGASKTFYQVLGVRPDAEPRDIKLTFWAFARKLHPDKVAHLPEGERDAARDRFYALREAYGVLSDPELRALYDRCLKTGESFQDAVEFRKPETQAERTARITEEENLAASEEVTLDLIVARLAQIAPRKGGWQPESETYGYFDRVLSSREAAHSDLLLIKILPSCSRQELEVNVKHAEGMLTTVPRSLIRSNFAYLLLAKHLVEPERLLPLVQDANMRLWTGSTGRNPRAMVMVCDVQQEAMYLPGVADPRPDLRTILLPSTPVPAPSYPGAPPSHPGWGPATGPSSAPGRKPAEMSSPGGSSVPPDMRAATTNPGQAIAPGPTILVVDDEEVHRSYLRKTLERGNWRVLEAENWPQFYHLVTTQPITVAIVDENLPDYSGGQLAQFVRTSELVNPKPMVVFYSCMERDHLRQLVAQTGAYGFLKKGEPATDVVIKVSAAVERYQALQDKDSSQST